MLACRQLKKAARQNLAQAPGHAAKMLFLAWMPLLVVGFCGAAVFFFVSAVPLFNSFYGASFHFEFHELSPVLLSGAIVCLLLLFTYIFINLVTTVGRARYFLKTKARLYPPASESYDPYKEGTAGNVVAVLLSAKLLVFIGTLFLIIPGILLAFRYSMLPFVLASDAGTDIKRAHALSRELMKDHWGDYLLLCLSFFGYFILCAVPFVPLFVIPYFQAAKAEFYLQCRAGLTEKGTIHVSDLPVYTDKANETK